MDNVDDQKYICIIAKTPEAVKEDEVDRAFALCINDVRFEVKSCCTIHLAVIAAKPTDIHVATKPEFAIHAGVLLENENKFFVTENGNTREYSHLVAHALYYEKSKDDWRSKLMVTVCNSRDTAINELQNVYKSEKYCSPVISSGFVSAMACFSLIQHIKFELNKPFDRLFLTRLSEGAEKAPDGVTNCALFAARLFYALAPSDDKEEIAVKNIRKTFKEIGLPETVLDKYIEDVRK